MVHKGGQACFESLNGTNNSLGDPDRSMKTVKFVDMKEFCSLGKKREREREKLHLKHS